MTNTTQPAPLSPADTALYARSARYTRACPCCFAIGQLVDLGDDNEACEECAQSMADGDCL